MDTKNLVIEASVTCTNEENEETIEGVELSSSQVLYSKIPSNLAITVNPIADPPIPSVVFELLQDPETSVVAPEESIQTTLQLQDLTLYQTRSVRTVSTPVRRRLMQELKWHLQDPPDGVSCVPTENDIMIWNAVIFGPDDTPFEDGIFKLTIEFTEGYPNEPPTVKFVSNMFHSNVYSDGRVALDILQNRWTPVYNVSAVLISIQSLLTDPNPNSAANPLAAQLYKQNRREYEERIKATVKQSWTN